MKEGPTAYYILREDLEYSSTFLFKLGLSNPMRSTCVVEILMMFNLQLMYNLEEKLIEDGVLFSWIEEDNLEIGILIQPTHNEIINKYLNDCMTMENYAKFRLKQFNEMTSDKDTKHPEYFLN